VGDGGDASCQPGRDEYERSKGIGGRLLDEVIAFARRSKANSLYLEVRVSNTIARKFYSERGFVPTYLRKGTTRTGRCGDNGERG